MATLLDFFKKIPSKKHTKTSPIVADSPGDVKSTSPQEKAKVFTPKGGKENLELIAKRESKAHVGNSCEDESPGSGSAKQDLNDKRAISDENSDDNSDDDAVTGRKFNSKRPKRKATSSSIKPSRKKLKSALDSDEDCDDMESGDEYHPPKHESSDESCSSGVEEVESEGEKSEDESPKISKKRKRVSAGNSSTRKSAKLPSTPSQSSPPTTPSSRLSTSLTSKLANSVGRASTVLSRFQASPSSSTEQCKMADEVTVYTHEKLEWLTDQKIRDKEGRRMNDPDYDPRTLHVPSSYLNSKEVTPGMRQWWNIKMNNFDTVLCFKVGKFYELYHMDAVIGVKELGLTYMKGKFAHAGFPEISYARYSDMFVQKGYKVARVEQTETPQMMSNRSSKEKVVRRELCAVTSKATKMFRFNEGDIADDAAAYLLAIKESGFEDVSGGESKYGVCFIDTSIGKFHLGEFSDDRQCSRLRTLIANHVPAQILFERGTITKKTQSVLQHEMVATLKEQLYSGSEFWNAAKTIKFLQENEYFLEEGEQKWPEALKEIANGDNAVLSPGEDSELAFSALGACIWYLKKCLIENELLSMKNFELYKPLDENNVHKKSVSFTQGRNHMMLDGVTLTNLDVVPNGADIPLEGTLLDQVQNCSTPFGKRLFKQWLCSPLCNPKSINDRLDSVEDLMSRHSLVSEAREILRSLPDLERLLRKIHSMGSVNRSQDHPDSRAIFYNEVTYSKKKIGDFLSTLEGFQNARKLCSLFEDHLETFKSKLLTMTIGMESSIEGGKFPEYKDELHFFKNAFDHKKAKEEGVILPKPGVDPNYDMAIQDVTSTKEKLNNYLDQQKKRLGCRSICYWGTGKNRYQLEIPENALARNTPSEYELQSSKKGFKRYWSPEIVRLNEELTDAEERRDASLKDTMRKVFYQFDERYAMWEKAVQCVAVLDCLISLMVYSSQTEGTMCRPEVIPIKDGDEPFIEILEGRHPCVCRTYSGGDFIPNDTMIGRCNPSDNQSSCVVVTGPNMGGKSTLMRQVGLIVILAQLGCYVPAEKCRLTPVDRVFTRLGAHDRILSGESTFFVELSETSCILRHATKHSLVLLDELGRGTATYDGTAIASAVIHNLSQDIQCRTLFSTHYHSLVEDFSNDATVRLGHMACMVENEDESGDPSKETITFLYKFVEGACPKSYGFNAARLASIPEEIIRVAINKAKEFEDNVERIKLFRALTSENNNNSLKGSIALTCKRLR
ncbi:DNA mismatch repair protein Msh6-like [Dendronephthya gigantea]|uniref:DNA mismatch repair protein Msh6-like n=1 Tax=Dendronephthya gigantea TaxID=151771 RepID=UPI00106DCAE7|nr:DNA mismatch repair protein Msh6-like [Dendronephthya gigantea]